MRILHARFLSVVLVCVSVECGVLEDISRDVSPEVQARAIDGEERPPRTTASKREPSEVLVVRGTVTPEGGSFLPFYRIPANNRNLKIAASPPPSGTYTVVLLDSDRRVLQMIAWTPDFSAQRTELPKEGLPFTWLLLPRDGVREVELRKNGKRVAGFRVRLDVPKIADLTVSSTRAVGESTTASLTWTVSAADTTKESSPRSLTHQVYYSNDDGVTWTLVRSGLLKSEAEVDLTKLPGGSMCRFRVSTTDGFNSCHRTGPAITVADKPPLCAIVAPRSGRTYRQGAGVLLIGRCVDLEDGALDGARFMWRSDTQGDLGTGAKVVVRNLRVGRHEIRLHATDSASNEGASPPIVVTVVAR